MLTCHEEKWAFAPTEARHPNDAPRRLQIFHNKELTMNWLAENWIWVLLGGGMVAMHLFGHRGHGGHGGHGGSCGGGHGNPKKEPAEAADGSRPAAPAALPDTHQH